VVCLQLVAFAFEPLDERQALSGPLRRVLASDGSHSTGTVVMAFTCIVVSPAFQNKAESLILQLVTNRALAKLLTFGSVCATTVVLW
jgi:hypothetical protein